MKQMVSVSTHLYDLLQLNLSWSAMSVDASPMKCCQHEPIDTYGFSGSSGPFQV